jgi:hypothetical protein
MSELDALLARANDPGAFVERRSFTLSRDKALEKMRKFSLRHPGQYALEIVQAAVFMGARWMFVDASEEAVTLGWIGGRSISHVELDGLFDYLFASESVAETRHLRQIAVAVNVLLQRKPSLLRIESGDEHGSARLDLNPDGTGTVGIPQDEMHGTYLRVEFTVPTWRRAFQMFRGRRAPEAVELIETECLYSPTSIFVNGSGPFGWDPFQPLTSLSVHRQKTFQTAERNGWIGLSDLEDRVTLVIGGVRISRRTIPELGPGICGVVRDDTLVKTADMSDIVDDGRWQRLLHFLQPLAIELHGSDALVPELDPLVEESATSKPDDTPMELPPIEEGLVVIGRSSPLRVPALIEELPANDTAYWVEPGDVHEVEAALDPLRFPARVLVLDAARVRMVSDEVPGLKLHRLLPADVPFVTEQIHKGLHVRTIEVERPDGVLSLRLHRDGRMPGWRVPGGVPALLAVGGRTVATRALPFEAPRVSVTYQCLRLDAEARATVWDDIANLVYDHLWRLVFPEEGDAPGEAERALARTVLAEALEVLPRPEAPRQVHTRLVRSWPVSAERLLDAPLTPSGCTATELIGVLGTNEAIPVGDSSDITALAPLMERLGVGHVAHPDLDGLGLVELRWNGQTWRLGDAPQPGPKTLALVRVAPTFRPSPPPGFTAGPSPHPILLAASREGLEDAVPWADGWTALARLLDDAAATEAVEQPSLWAGNAIRRDDLLRLARLALHPHGATIRFRASDGSRVPFSAVFAGKVRLAYRAGPEVFEAQTVLVTADEAALLQTLGATLDWRFDDAPSVWTQTPDDDDSRWLIRREVAGLAGQGWLGLRMPYDPTASVFVRRGWRTRVATELDHGLRCHGWIHARGEHGHDGLSELQDAAIGLLEDLATALENGFSGPDAAARHDAAQRYAADFAWMGRRPDTPTSVELAERLARCVAIPLPDSEQAWGTLLLWWQSTRDLRPPLPFAVHGFDGRPVDVDVDPVADLSEALSVSGASGEGAAERRSKPAATEAVLLHAVRRMDLGTDVSLHLTGNSHHVRVWGKATLHVELGMRDVVVASAMAGDVQAVARLLLRVARAIHSHEADSGRVRDFPSMQAAVFDTLAHARLLEPEAG